MTKTTTATTAARGCEAFIASADSYDRLMGRYLPSLAPMFADAAGVGTGMRLMDVGCGPGGLTAELARRAGAARVAAIDPSAPFVQECRRRTPGVDVREGVAEHLPFDADEFDASLASLVVGFMSDPRQGVAEMARVTRPEGTVAVCFWDFNRMPVLETFWAAARTVNPTIAGEMRRPGGARGELAALLREAGLRDVREAELVAEANYADFDDFWSPFTLGVGPIGLYYGSLDDTQREAVRVECVRLLDRRSGPFSLEATCWFAAGVVAAPTE
jgi:ubiquinone/menaquinone biosynthesis C-methylase UbiE